MNRKLRALSDEELASLAARGSSAAFEVIYDRHAAGVARALASFAGTDRDLLDDLVQDVFLRVIRGLPSYGSKNQFAGWLFTIALNVGRNHARRQDALVMVEPERLDEIAAAAATDMDPSVMMDIVSQLPIEMREVVALRVGSDLPYAEIAGLLGIPEGTARSRMHNAIRILRKHYHNHRGRERRA